MMSMELDYSNCNSFKAFNPVFNDGLCDLISNVFLNSNSFQLSAFHNICIILQVFNLNSVFYIFYL